MRVLMLHGPGDLRLEEAPDPVAGPGELVVEIGAALTCATDAKMMRAGTHPALGQLPAALGHELAGIVADTGPGVDAWRQGDAVVVANSAPCTLCPECRAGRPSLCRAITYLTGAFGERVRVPAAIASHNTHALPPGVPPELGAMAEPLACAVHTARACAPAGPREVVILGGGVQGWFLTALMSAAGDRVTLLDPHADRRARALGAGAADARGVPGDEEALAALRASVGGGSGPDLVVEAVGRPQAWRMAVSLVRAGGEVVLHGGCAAGTEVTLPAHPLHYSELIVRGSYHHTPDAFREAVQLLASGRIDGARLLADRILLADVPDVLRASRGDKHPVMPNDE